MATPAKVVKLRKFTALRGCAQLSPEEARAWYGFRRASMELAREVDARLASVHNLQLSAHHVLFRVACAERGSLRMSDLADATGLSPSRVSRLVDQLERDGLIGRRPCDEDARAVDAFVTDEGFARLRAAQITHVEVVREIFLSRFSSEELQLLGDFFERLAPGRCG